MKKSPGKKTVKCTLLCVVGLWCFAGFGKVADKLIFDYCNMFASQYQKTLMEVEHPSDMTVRGKNRQNRFLPKRRDGSSDVYWICDFKIGANAYTAHFQGFYYAVENNTFTGKKVYNKALSKHTQGDIIQIGAVDLILKSGRRSTPIKVYIAITQFYKSDAFYPLH